MHGRIREWIGETTVQYKRNIFEGLNFRCFRGLAILYIKKLIPQSVLFAIKCKD